MKKEMLRFQLVGVVLAAAAFIVVAQIIRIQYSPQGAALVEAGNIYKGYPDQIQPIRGQIYDRWGNLLAGNTTTYQIGVELANVRSPETIARAISLVTGADYNRIFMIASIKASPNAVYATLVHSATQEQVEALQEISASYQNNTEVVRGRRNASTTPQPSMAGVVYTPLLTRIYPEETVASNLLGFVSQEGRGYYGVEEKYNDLLTGTPRSVLVTMDPYKVESNATRPEGASLVLTIDRAVQAAVEEILDKHIRETGSASGTIVVLQPETGEILAIATTPRMNPNEFWRQGEIFPGETPYNRGVMQAYEPGSVFKVITMAAALDSGTVKPDTPFLDTGVYTIGGIYIYNWNMGAWGPQTMLGCMQHSLNVCLAWLANEIGAPTFYTYLQRFGFGRPTGSDLAGEVSGRVKLPGDGDWYEADLGTNSFGQGIAATPLQMAMAVSAIANDGKMVTPHIVRSIIDNGRQYDISPQVVSEPISAETARTLTNMLMISLEEEASAALVPGYRVAGKTGTAEIPTPSGYSTNQTNASFVGWGPVDDPKFLVYIWLEKPTTSPWGSVVASPVFSDVVQRLVVLMDIPPDEVRANLASR
jgi:cell division protein FtsI/penicillin-binding protein 2